MNVRVGNYVTLDPLLVGNSLIVDRVHHEALRNWIRQDEADRGERDDRLTTAEKEELAALRRENAELRRSCEILKAASAFFAQELDPTRRRY